MGVFATYTGFIYNDIFSKSLHLFRSGWDLPVNGTVKAFNGYTYPFGLDPGWHGASNALIFSNSFKMKSSIVIGVIHVKHSCFYFRKIRTDPPTDDFRPLFASSKSHQIQKLFGHLDELRSADVVPAVHFRLFGGLHPVQVVGGLVQVLNGTSVPTEHVDQHVPITGNHQP